MRHRSQILPMKRPGLSVRPGSKRRLISRISGSASGVGPHTSIFPRRESGSVQHNDCRTEWRQPLAQALDQRHRGIGVSIERDGHQAGGLRDDLDLAAIRGRPLSAISEFTEQISPGSTDTFRISAALAIEQSLPCLPDRFVGFSQAQHFRRDFAYGQAYSSRHSGMRADPDIDGAFVSSRAVARRMSVICESISARSVLRKRPSPRSAAIAAPSTVQVRACFSTGCKRKLTSAITPSVPKLPVISLCRS